MFNLYTVKYKMINRYDAVFHINSFNFMYCIIDKILYEDYDVFKQNFYINSIIVFIHNDIKLFLKNGEFHNEHNAAITFGTSKQYFLNNQEMYYNEWKKQCRLIKLKNILYE